VARRGAREVTRTGDESGERREQPERRGSARPKPRKDAWSRDDGRDEWADSPPKKRTKRNAAAPRAESSTATSRTKSAAPTTTSSTARALAVLAAADGRSALPPDVATEIRNAADIATQAHQERLVERAEAAFRGYERGRYQDALRAIKQVVDEAPGVAAVRELAGLAAYRSGRWREAARHLTAFGNLSDSATHLPELMDCQRALHKPKKVAELWTELRQSSPDPDVLAEGRIVAASSLADTGDLKGAISMLSTAGASKMLRNPADRHLRQWYVLADLYERAGDIPRAREYFERVRHADPQAYDVSDRLRSLGPQRRSSQKRPAKKATR
jgi:tetratricopeptide (TPR) repeat protein